MGRPRVVIVSYVVPYDDVAHAGGRYLGALCRVAAEGTAMALLAPSTTVNEQAVVSAGAPASVLLVGRPGTTMARRIVNRVSLALDRMLRRFDPGLPYLPFVAGILTSCEARALVRSADVLDLQWFDSIRMGRWLRPLNRGAKRVGTFHDVQSQAFDREAANDPDRAAYWQRAASRTRRLERAAVAALDRVLTFSDKDLALLGNPGNGGVIRPPLTSPSTSYERTPADMPTVVFVSFLARDENDQAARWLLDEIWPLVMAGHPEAHLWLVGAGARQDLARLAEQLPSVTISGYVPDLDAIYARAWATVTPLKRGGGVKFKVVESLLAGVPTVTTTVGSEGIASEEFFAGVSDSAPGLAAALVSILDDPTRAFAQATLVRGRLAEEFGEQQFSAALARVWGSD